MSPPLLVVEDNPDTQTLLRYLLRQRYALTLVGTAGEALAAARELRFRVGVIDINLGREETGIDLLHQLRALSTYGDVPTIALTAYALPGDRERILASGFDRYVSKPFAKQQLLDSIQELLPPA